MTSDRVGMMCCFQTRETRHTVPTQSHRHSDHAWTHVASISGVRQQQGSQTRGATHYSPSRTLLRLSLRSLAYAGRQMAAGWRMASLALVPVQRNARCSRVMISIRLLCCHAARCTGRGMVVPRVCCNSLRRDMNADPSQGFGNHREPAIQRDQRERRQRIALRSDHQPD